jgi:serine/threonine-protein kinase RsbW
MTASVTLRNERGESIRLGDFAAGFARENGLPDDERTRLLIILEELFTNAVAYGYAPGATGGITVTLQRERCRLVIDFVDDGQPFDPLAFPEPDLDVPEEERAIGGLGIHIVRSFVDEARYNWKNGRNHLHLVRRIGTLSEAGD